MSAGRDFEAFCEDVLLACAEAQTGFEVEPVEIDDLCAAKFPDSAPTWIDMVTETLAQMGFGQDWSTHDGHTFLINGNGLLKAGEIRDRRRPKSLSEKARAVPRSDWIALGAFIVSIIALLK